MEKTYINGFLIKEKTFQDGGSILNCSIKIDDFAKDVKAHAKDGWLNISISKRKTPSDKGISHYVTLNTYEKKEEENNSPF